MPPVSTDAPHCSLLQFTFKFLITPSPMTFKFQNYLSEIIGQIRRYPICHRWRHRPDGPKPYLPGVRNWSRPGPGKAPSGVRSVCENTALSRPPPSSSPSLTTCIAPISGSGCRHVVHDTASTSELQMSVVGQPETRYQVNVTNVPVLPCPPS